MQWLPLETAWSRLPEGLRVPSRDKGEEHKHMYGFRANGTIFIRGHTHCLPQPQFVSDHCALQQRGMWSQAPCDALLFSQGWMAGATQ